MLQNPSITAKVSQKIKIIYNLNNKQGPSNPRYKTTLCKHFDTPQGCSYGDKCQFAHGKKELRMNNAQGFPQMNLGGNANKNQNNILNYKIVKCKNYEKDGTCKYGNHCTFAHGDKELRNKTENLYQMNNPMMMSVPFGMEGIPVMIPPGMDMNQMQLIMPSGGNMGQNPYMMMNMMPQNLEGMNNNQNNNNESGEQKPENKPQ